MRMEIDRHRRTAVQQSAELVDAILTHAKRNGVTIAELGYAWVASAAWLAANGRGDLLPSKYVIGVDEPVRGERLKWMRFTQGAAEYERFKTVIEAAGSSIPAVLREAGQAYIDAGGDLLAMDWPPIRSLSFVA